MATRCQVCQRERDSWRVSQASFDVGTLRNYKLQVCDDCAKRIEDALIPSIAIRRAEVTK